MSQNTKNRREVAERLADSETRKLLTAAGDEWHRSRPDQSKALALLGSEMPLARNASPATAPEHELAGEDEGAEFWRALDALERQIQAALARLVAAGYAGHVDVRLFSVHDRTLTASVVTVEDGDRLPDGDGTSRWFVSPFEKRKVA